MKTIYLLNKTLPDGSVCLAVASAAEGREVTRANKGLPPERRRYFITDYIKDGAELDCMIIEVSSEVYRAWNKEHLAARRNQKAGRGTQHLSLNTPYTEQRISSEFLEQIPSSENVEAAACDAVLMDELRKALAAWKPWGNDLLDLYLLGQKRTCTKILSLKYGVSRQVIRKYKRQFEKFIKNFLEVFRFDP